MPVLLFRVLIEIINRKKSQTQAVKAGACDALSEPELVAREEQLLLRSDFPQAIFISIITKEAQYQDH